jgi:ATP/maltotriose-dependent transcriptional regulator MalT
LQIVPELRAHFPEIAPASIEGEASRFAVYDSVTQLLLKVAARGPLVLVLEDLHWADASSLILLQLLAGAIPHAALMVIGTYRERELSADHPLRARLADFVRRGETLEISLVGLTDEEVASLVRAQTAFEAEANFVRRLQTQTAGNPLFVKELMRALGDDRSIPPAAQSQAVPQGISALLRRRTESLSGGCREMLEIAAVAGQELQIDLLAAAIGVGRAPILDLCDEAVASGIVTALDRGFVFTHGLYRDTIYGSLSTMHRAKLHGVVAGILEQGPPPGIQTPAVRLAYHFLHAVPADQSLQAKAAQLAATAARQAVAELAYEEAARLLEQAIAVAAPANPRERAELLLELGRARYMAGDIGGALDAADRAADLGEELDDANLLARAALVVRGVGGPGLSHRIVRLTNMATRREIRDKALRIQVLSQLTVALMQTGHAPDEEAAKEASREAVELAKDAVDPDVVFAGIHARQMVTSGPDGVDERLELAERTLRLAQETGRASMAGWGHTWRLDALVQLGRISEAEAEVAAQVRLADELHEPLARWRAVQARSWLALLRGRFGEARTLAEEARDLGRKGHHAAAEFTYLTHLVVLGVYLGGLESALRAMQDLLRPIPESSSDPIFVSGALALIGRFDEARLALRPIAATGYENVGPAIAMLPGAALVTEAIFLLGEADLAEPVYQATLPFARLNVSAGASGLYGSVARYLGMLASVLERWDDAAKHFEDGMELERRMGAPPFIARTRIAYAEMLLKRGRDADLRHARQLLDAGLAACRDLGMKPWEQRASTLLSGLSARGIADHPLSSRELEVATLVAEGLSNRAIAERLHLSERTAESHVKNICDKLGFNSRSQVAAWVAARKPIA